MQWAQVDLGGVVHLDVIDVGTDGVLWDSSPAPTVTLYHRAGGELQASVSASTGATYSVSSASTAGDQTVSLASTTGLVRWEPPLLLRDTSGAWEWIEAESISGGTLTLVEPLENGYSVGATLRSPRLSATVAASSAASPQHACRADWAFSVGGSARRESTTFSIARYAPRLNVTARDITNYDPRAATMLGSDQELDRLVGFVWNRRVLIDVARLLGTPGAMISGEDLDHALITRVLADLYMRAEKLEIADRYEAQYAQAIDGIRQTAVDLDEDGGQDANEIPRSRRAVRILRG